MERQRLRAAMRGSRDEKSERLFVWAETGTDQMERIRDESVGGTKHVRCLADRAGQARRRVSACAGERGMNQWWDVRQEVAGRRSRGGWLVNVGEKDFKSVVVISETNGGRRCKKQAKGREAVREQPLFS